MLPKPKTLRTLLSIVVVLLLIPFIAMQFTNEVNWSVMDFVMAGILLFSTSLVIEFVLRKVKSTKHRILISVIILLTLFLLWAELAVASLEVLLLELKKLNTKVTKVFIRFCDFSFKNILLIFYTKNLVYF